MIKSRGEAKVNECFQDSHMPLLLNGICLGMQAGKNSPNGAAQTKSLRREAAVVTAPSAWNRIAHRAMSS